MISHNYEPLHNFPQELKCYDCWMGTRLEWNPKLKKWDKPPYRVRNGSPIIKAGKTNPDNWATFNEAYDALKRGVVDAIGLVFNEHTPLTVIDLDNAIDPETGEITAEAAGLLTTFANTYAEISVSGTGLHIICEAEKPGERCRTRNVEMYDGEPGARFMVITGNQISLRREISRCQEEVKRLYNDLFDTEASCRHDNQQSAQPHALELNELLKRARKSKTGAHFRKLFDRGDTSGYKSASDADYALINTLIFWCAGDADMVEEGFKASALYRPPPEKHKNYVRISVRNALRSYKGSFYQPKALREKSTPEKEDVLAPYLALLLDAAWWKGKRGASAFKAYSAAIILAVEAGIANDAEELHIGTDLRRFAEVAGLSRQTLGNSALPYLVQDVKLLRWERGRGDKASKFVLPKPKMPSTLSIKESTHFNGKSWRDSLDSLAKLVRMRSGVSRTGKVNELGKFETVPRLGMVSMFALLTLTTSPRGLNIDELVERLGRRKDNVRSTMRKLVAAEIAEEPREDFFTLAPAFWSAYDRELFKSGIVAAERRQRKKHKKERRDNELSLQRGRQKARIKADPKVTELPTNRLRQIDEDTRLNQPRDECPPRPVERRGRVRRRHMWEDRDWLAPEEQAMQDDYDLKIRRAQERLARRASSISGGVSEESPRPSRMRGR